MRHDQLSKLSLLGLAFALGCSATTSTPAPAPAQPPEIPAADRPYIERARAALLPLKKMLKKELSAAMVKGGPLAAIEVCRSRAAAITQQIDAANPSLQLGRTSDRLRSAKNKAADWLEPMLAHYQGSTRSAGSYQLSHLSDGKVGYAEPIYAGGVCLKCHGAKVAPPVAEALKKHYPEDKATGYAAGQFRGLFWVKLDK